MLWNELSCPPRPFFAPGWRKKLHFQKGQYTAGARSAPLKPRKPKARAGWFAGSLRMKQSINILLCWSYWSHPRWLQSWNTLPSTCGGCGRAPSAQPKRAAGLAPLRCAYISWPREKTAGAPRQQTHRLRHPEATSSSKTTWKERSLLWTVNGWGEMPALDGLRTPFLHPLAHSEQQSSRQSTWAKLGPVQLVHPWKLSGEGSQCRCCELAPVYTSTAHHGSSHTETDGFFYSPPFDSHPTARIAPMLTSNPLWQ